MGSHTIKCYSQQHTATAHEFYILSKGNNSGKPMQLPCPNCFVCICDSEQHKEYMYYILFGLWQGRCFHYYLKGTTIPFGTIGDVKKCIANAIDKATAKQELYVKNISTLVQMDEYSKRLTQQLQLIKQMKCTLMHEILR